MHYQSGYFITMSERTSVVGSQDDIHIWSYVSLKGSYWLTFHQEEGLDSSQASMRVIIHLNKIPDNWGM